MDFKDNSHRDLPYVFGIKWFVYSGILPFLKLQRHYRLMLLLNKFNYLVLPLILLLDCALDLFLVFRGFDCT